MATPLSSISAVLAAFLIATLGSTTLARAAELPTDDCTGYLHVNWTIPSGVTLDELRALPLAACLGRTGVVQYWLQPLRPLGKPVEQLDSIAAEEFLDSPLEAAIRGGYASTVAALLSVASDRSAQSALTDAIEQGQLNIALIALKSGHKLGDAPSEALWTAAKHGAAAFIAPLVAAGANLNYSRERRTPLMLAIEQDDAAFARQLLDARANVDALVLDDDLCEDVCCSQSTLQYSALMLAAKLGKLEMVDLLLSRGASSSLTTASLDNALLNAAENGRTDIVAFLVRQPKIDLKRLGPKALTLAEENEHLDIIEVLRHSGVTLGSRKRVAKISVDREHWHRKHCPGRAGSS